MQRQNETNTSCPPIDNTRSTTWVDPRTNATALGSAVGDGRLPSGWEIRPALNSDRTYFVDHNTKISTWDDPRLPLVDANVSRDKLDFHKLLYFRSRPDMRPPIGEVRIEVRRNHIFEDSYKEVMRQTPNYLKKRLMITFEGEPVFDDNGVSKSVASVHNLWAEGPYL